MYMIDDIDDSRSTAKVTLEALGKQWQTRSKPRTISNESMTANVTFCNRFDAISIAFALIWYFRVVTPGFRSLRLHSDKVFFLLRLSLNLVLLVNVRRK